MPKKLSDAEWSDIRTRYELGGGIRAIARDYNIPHGTIQNRIKKQNWKQELASKVTDLTNKIDEISHIIKPEQVAIIEEHLHQEIEQRLAINKGLHNIAKGGMTIHNIILKNTYKKVLAGQISEKEAAQILSNQGLKITSIRDISNLETNINDLKVRKQ